MNTHPSGNDGDELYKAWRRKAEKFARKHHFYWLPCVICGRPHGGQEANGSIYVGRVDGGGVRYQGICPHCTAARMEAAERRLRELGETVQVHATASSWSGGHPAQTIFPTG
jgi:hypothetical protein